MNLSDKNKHDLTIVVNTCDAYQDVLGIFFHAFKEFWPNCPYPIVINTESSNAFLNTVKVHNHIRTTVADDWGDRLRSTLNSIETEFVLMLYDDFIVDTQVNSNGIQQALQLLISQVNNVVAYLTNTSLSFAISDSDQLFLPLKDRIDYRVNSAPGIWRRNVLLNYTAAGDNPWAWEVFGTYRSWGDGNLFYSINPRYEDIYSYNYSKGGAIYRGKWVREVVDQVIQRYSLNIDWSKRGFSSETNFEKRSLIWKIRFMQTGFKMVGFKAMYFLIGYIKDKINAKK